MDGDDLLKRLRAWGLTLPGAYSRSPWPGHDDLAVNDRTFAFLSAEGEPFTVSVKLPYTHPLALDLPFAKSTGYGLGKSGWVTFTPSDPHWPDLDQLKAWVDESYRARAPKRLIRELDAREDQEGMVMPTASATIP